VASKSLSHIRARSTTVIAPTSLSDALPILLTAGGKFCTYVGQVLLTWDHDARKLIKKEAYTTDITYLPDDPETNDLLKELRNQSNKVLNKKVTELNQPLKADWHHETP